MSLDYDYLMGLAPMETIHDVGRRDTILYALGVSLAAYGIVGGSLVKALCEDRPERLRRMDVRLVERGLMAQQNGYAQFDA